MHGCVAKEPGDDPAFSTIITHSSSPAGFQMHGCVVKQTCENLESNREWRELAQVTQPVFSSVLSVCAHTSNGTTAGKLDLSPSKLNLMNQLSMRITKICHSSDALQHRMR